MAGFLNAFIPLGEVAGDTAATIGAHDQRSKALQDLVSGMGPDYAQFGKAVSAGVKPDTAMSFIQTAQQQKAQQQFAQMYQQAGVMTPDVIAYGLRTGAIDPKSIPGLTKPPAGQIRDADTNYVNALLASETNPANQAKLTAIRDAVAQGAPLSSFSSLITSMGKPPPPEKLQHVLQQGYDEYGRPIQVPENYDPTKGTFTVARPTNLPATDAGGPVTSGGFISSKPNAQEQKTLDEVQGYGLDRGKIDATIHAVMNATPDELARQYGLYRTPFGLAGRPDPEFAAYFSAVGKLKTDLLGVQMNSAGGSRSRQVVDELLPHIPSELNSPWQNQIKLKEFDDKMQEIRQEYGIVPVPDMSGTGATTIGGPSSLPPPPPFAYDKAYTDAAGNYVVHRVDDGKNYIIDTGSKSWVPASPR